MHGMDAGPGTDLGGLFGQRLRDAQRPPDSLPAAQGGPPLVRTCTELVGYWRSLAITIAQCRESFRWTSQPHVQAYLRGRLSAGCRSTASSATESRVTSASSLTPTRSNDSASRAKIRSHDNRWSGASSR